MLNSKGLCEEDKLVLGGLLDAYDTQDNANEEDGLAVSMTALRQKVGLPSNYNVSCALSRLLHNGIINLKSKGEPKRSSTAKGKANVYNFNWEAMEHEVEGIDGAAFVRALRARKAVTGRNMTQLDSTQHNMTGRNMTQLDSTQLDSTQLDSTQLDSTQLDSTQHDLTQGNAYEAYEEALSIFGATE